MSKKVVTFGEIMLRLSTPGYERFRQARSFDVVYGGGEANVAAALANYGVEAEFITRLPANDLGEACLGFLRSWNVNTQFIVRGGDRIGIYFLETGVTQRPSKVIYDRANSSFATIGKGMIDWDKVFQGADWFHWTGITPAVSKGAMEACLEGVEAAHRLGLTISCDLNYRAKLWKWTDSPRNAMEQLVSYCDVAVGNEEDADKVFGIKAPDSDVTQGKVGADGYRCVCEQLAKHLPSLKTVAITLRGSLSASHNTWSGVLWNQGQFYTGPQYDIFPIVDRVGGGDSFSGGLIYGLRAYPGDPERALKFALAASCLKHSIPGDFNVVQVGEVETLLKGDQSGRISR